MCQGGSHTHTHTHSLTHSLTHTHTHTHATTHSLARSFAHSFLSHPRNRTIITVTQACTHKRTDAYTHTESHSRQQCARKPNRCILSCSPRATLPFSDLHFQACFPVCRPQGSTLPFCTYNVRHHVNVQHMFASSLCAAHLAARRWPDQARKLFPSLFVHNSRKPHCMCLATLAS